MVSLSRDFSSSTGGGVFFNDASLNSGESETHMQLIAGNDELKGFNPLCTIPVAVFQLIISIGILVLAIVLSFFWPGEREKCDPYFILLYVHAAFWCFSLIIHNYLKAKHHMLRVNGYLEFYQETHTHLHIPFFIVSLWNTIILIVGTVFHQLYKNFEDQCQSSEFFTPVKCVCLIIVLEVVVLTPFIGTYIKKVSEFNKGQPLPDIQQDEWMSNFIQDSYSGGEIGYREQSGRLHDLLEKQADVIRYLKERNSQLSRRILVLHTQVHSN